MSYRDVILAQGASAYWRFEETSGDIVTDEVDGFQSSVYNANLDVPGYFGSGAYFDGVDDYIALTESVETSIASQAQMDQEWWVHDNAISFSTWVYFTRDTTYERIASQGGDGGTEWNLSKTTGNGLHVEVSAGFDFGAAFAPDDSLPINEWVHVGFVFDKYTELGAEDLYLFINGQEPIYQSRSQVSNTTEVAYADVYLGTDDDLSGWFQGYLDEPAYFQAPLTSADFLEQYQADDTSQTITARLLEGTTEIASWEMATPGDFDFELTQAEAASITNYSDLRVEFTGDDTARVTYVAMLVPDAGDVGTVTSLTWAEDDDVNTVSVTYTPPPADVSLAWTEDDDAIEVVAEHTPPDFSATLAWSEDDDVAAITASVAVPHFEVSSAWIEEDDVVALEATHTPQTFDVSLTWVEDSDVVAITATLSEPSFNASLGWSEDDDVVAISGAQTPPTFDTSIAWVEDDDTTSIDASLLTPGQLEPADLVVGLEIESPSLNVASTTGGSWWFDGGYLEASDSPTLRSLTTEGTWWAWARIGFSSQDTWSAIIHKNHDTSSPHSSWAISRRSDSTDVYATRGRSGDHDETPREELTIGPSTRWVFYAATFEAGDVIRLRAWEADGTLFGDVTGPATSDDTLYSTLPLRLMRNEASGHLDGHLACVGAHNTVVSDADLDTIRTTGVPPFTPSAFFLSLDTDTPTDTAQGNPFTAFGAAEYDPSLGPPVEPPEEEVILEPADLAVGLGIEAPSLTPSVQTLVPADPVVSFQVESPDLSVEQIATPEDYPLYDAVMADGPDSFWPLFNDGEDRVGTRDFTAVGATFASTTDTEEQFQGWAEFDGVDDYLRAPPVNFPGPMTYELWAHIPTNWSGSDDGGQLIGSNDRVGMRRASSGTHMAAVVRDGSGSDILTDGTGTWGNVVFGSTEPTWSTWQHWVFTYDGTDVRGYIDGVLMATLATNGNDLATDVEYLTLGAQYDSPTNGTIRRFFAGRLAWVAVYDKVLTDQQVETHYLAGQEEPSDDVQLDPADLPFGLQVESPSLIPSVQTLVPADLVVALQVGAPTLIPSGQALTLASLTVTFSVDTPSITVATTTLYDLQRERWDGSAWVDSFQIDSITSPPYTDDSLDPDTLYRWRVRQHVDGDTSDWSEWVEQTTLPDTSQLDPADISISFQVESPTLESAFEAVSSDDSLSVELEETEDVFVKITSEDSLGISVAESTTTDVYFSSTDSLGVSVDETPDLFSSLSAVDWLDLSLTESFAFDVVEVAAADEFNLSVDDDSSIFASLESDDVAHLALDETYTFAPVEVTASDALSLEVTEDSSVSLPVEASDTLSLSLAEEEDLVATGLTFVSDDDNLVVGVSDTAEIDVRTEVTSDDTIAMSIEEAATFGLVEVVADDSFTVSVFELTELLATLNSEETLAVGLDETYSFDLQEVSSQDTLNVSVTETSDVDRDGDDARSTDSLALELEETSSVEVFLHREDALSLSVSDEVSVLQAFLHQEDALHLGLEEVYEFAPVVLDGVDALSIQVTEEGLVSVIISDTDNLLLAGIETVDSLLKLEAQPAPTVGVARRTTYGTMRRTAASRAMRKMFPGMTKEET